jgi:hypothetical protein
VLADHPDQRRQLVGRPDLVPNAIEELLRYESPSPVQARYVTKDVEHHGQTVPAGSALLLLTASANRDERKFPDGDTFDIHRDIDRQLAFGYGIHFCLGSAWPGWKVGSPWKRSWRASPRGRSTGTMPCRPGRRPCAGGNDSPSSRREGERIMKTVVVGASSGLGRSIAIGLGQGAPRSRCWLGGTTGWWTQPRRPARGRWPSSAT